MMFITVKIGKNVYEGQKFDSLQTGNISNLLMAFSETGSMEKTSDTLFQPAASNKSVK